MKFIIVDDNEQFRAYVRELLVKPGDECRELDNGLLVNDVYNEFRPDWVLLDIQMKPMDGFKTAERLREHYPDAQFAMVSNFCDARFRKKAQMLGAAALISKENLQDLAELVMNRAYD
jgi:DNA-binding NarL/FixJ family response regulator